MKRTLQRWLAWFVHLHFGTKLAISFAVVLGLTVLLGGFSVLNLWHVNKASSDLAQKWMPSVGHTTTTRTAILEFRDYETRHTHALDASYMAEYEDKMKEALGVINTQMGSYAKLVQLEEEQALLASFNKAWTAYQGINKNVVSLGRANKQKDAVEIGEGAAKMTSDEAIDALDKITAFNFEGGTKAADAASAIYTQARFWTVVVLLAAVAIGAMFAILITRELLNVMGGEPADATALTEDLASGKLYVDIALRPGDRDSVLAGIVNIRDSLSRIVREVRSRADGIATSSTEIAQGNHDLSSRTEQQANALQSTANSMTQLNSTVRQNADGARQANQLAHNASEVAAQGGEVVAKVVNTMKGINDSSRKIADIISVIDGIAFQTNILALNAAVEAARAGEQGRGFAVVASEVRSLAGRSAEAAKEIKSLISASVERVEQGTALVDQAGTTMNDVVTAIRRVTDLMSDISAASEEQSQEVGRVGVAITQMDEVTQQNAALVEEMAAAASSLSTQATELVDAVAVFELQRGNH